MENWRLKGLVESARNLAKGLENLAKEQVEPSSAAEAMESSPDDPMRPALRAELCVERQLRHQGEANLAHRLEVAEARLAALEAGQQSPQSGLHTTAEVPPGETASITTEAGWDVDWAWTPKGITFTIHPTRASLPLALALGDAEPGSSSVDPRGARG
jgi:hypothetical protein